MCAVQIFDPFQADYEVVVVGPRGTLSRCCRISSSQSLFFSSALKVVSAKTPKRVDVVDVSILVAVVVKNGSKALFCRCSCCAGTNASSSFPVIIVKSLFHQERDVKSELWCTEISSFFSPKKCVNISMSSVSFERWLLDQNVLFDATAIEFVVSNTTTPNATTKVLGKRRIHHREKIIIRIPFQACFTFETSALFARMNEKASKRRWKKRLEYVLKKRTKQSSLVSDWLSALTLALLLNGFAYLQKREETVTTTTTTTTTRLLLKTRGEEDKEDKGDDY